MKIWRIAVATQSTRKKESHFVALFYIQKFCSHAINGNPQQMRTAISKRVEERKAQ